MRVKAQSIIGPALGLLVFAAALFVLRRELTDFDFSDIAAAFSRMKFHLVVLAATFTACSYITLTLYDALSLRYIGQRLSYGRIAFASFLGYAISHSLGFPLLTGGAVRYRLYSSWEVSSVDIVKATAFNGVIFWVGILSILGV